MRILYLSQYFPPENGATQVRSFEMARRLVQQGHEVTVIANVPNHPEGIIHPEFKNVWYKKDELEGIDVRYVKVAAFREKSFKKRIIFYLSYMFTAALAGLLMRRKKYDCIYATSPPLFVGGAAIFLKWVKKIPMYFEVRDPWPQAAVELGLVQSGMAIKMATLLEEACYRNAEKIVVVTETVRDMLLQRNVPPEKMIVIPNGATVESFYWTREGRDEVRKNLGMEDSFIVLHAGNMGVAQDLHTILNAAKLMEDEPRYQFLMVGTGPVEKELRDRARELKLKNLHFLGYKPRREMPPIFSACDAAAVTSKALDVFKSMKPVKMYDSWACQVPVLLGMEGESKDLVQAVNGGVCYTPENPEDMVRAIREMDALGFETRRDMGEKLRQYVIDNYSRASQARVLEQVLLGRLP
ncbi:Glycosyltransferase involved in cell wall bisynthesis [Desulfatibacillum alkenivorans DSM 16219]|jgi:glycosyltransferase involved in cell wall biosynthesis|uniref:Glycosyltransferase involved in cell wall bisynthesis n=1 Tax=Desulfatibacillum alkenivorans DSM 16219 TaxID=1121393 RepID=A0A1M6FCF7_9BACT|nr:glycosyltransferase family 4 protein [Desulfatibacillum alkenivorans]SHI95326.1 Glycosyltransferase involved in cell wall bisynthesis [Desulfatibacillum alkenivorans DSM 16219]